ncbi:hypothetical protein F3Y22_tig00110387pilonHSYRG00750 [Hibiscus syriacus]|uniref:RNase H type-1 domain-containing protein n=1 Tax=Hibiscus syriacus TaxID=106335 RepID=A0A6A3AT24_HIBSY|nr:hypothetical protein F3Y22_tig00110387pilonHSYRG00750 [Hibiscus syriacus]
MDGSLLLQKRTTAVTEGCRRGKLGLNGSATEKGSPIYWSPPMEGWFKVNTDAARSEVDGRASCGGLIRDNIGRWRAGFAKFIGICSTLEAELWGIYIGMVLAWDLGIRRVIVESDNKEAILLVSGVAVRHVDKLAKLTPPDSFDIAQFTSPPLELRTLLQAGSSNY